MPAKLVMIEGPKVGQSIPLGDLPLVVGRTDDADYVIAHASISRKHAEIIELPEGYMVRDLGSKNGIEIRGKKVSEIKLVHNDIIKIGKISIRFQHPEAKPDPDPTPAPAPAVPVPPANAGGAPSAPAVPPAPAPISPGGQPLAANAPVAAVASGEGEELEEDESRNRRNNLILTVVLALGLVLAVLALVLSQDTAPPPPKVVLMKVGEERLVMTLPVRNFVEAQVDTTGPATIKRDKEKTWLLHVAAKRQGEVRIRLMNGAENPPLGEMKVIIRGQVEPLIGSELDNEIREDRLRIAKAEIESGDNLLRDSMHQSIKHYERAMAIYKLVQADHPDFFVAKDKYKAAKDEMDNLLETYWKEFNLAYNKGRDRDGMAKALSKILKLIPDDSSLDYQRAKIYAGFLKG